MTDIVERLRAEVRHLRIDNARLRDEAFLRAAMSEEAADEIERLRKALMPFAHYCDLNDCDERRDDDALEVPIRDLRRASRTLRIVGIPSTLAEGES